MTTRDEVMAHLVDFMLQAKSEGRDGYARAREVFRDVPSMVLGEAWAAAEMQNAETWWKGVERTIESEVIARAIGETK